MLAGKKEETMAMTAAKSHGRPLVGRFQALLAPELFLRGTSLFC